MSCAARAPARIALSRSDGGVERGVPVVADALAKSCLAPLMVTDGGQWDVGGDGTFSASDSYLLNTAMGLVGVDGSCGPARPLTAEAGPWRPGMLKLQRLSVQTLDRSLMDPIAPSHSCILKQEMGQAVEVPRTRTFWSWPQVPKGDQSGTRLRTSDVDCTKIQKGRTRTLPCLSKQLWMKTEPRASRVLGRTSRVLRCTSPVRYDPPGHSDFSARCPEPPQPVCPDRSIEGHLKCRFCAH